MAKKKPAKKQPNTFQKLVAKATGTRRAMFVTGLVGVLLFSSVGYYVINRSSAGTYASICGTGYSLKRVLRDSYGNYNRGEVRVFTKQTGTNTDWCAFTIHKDVTYGKSLDTLIEIVGYNTAGYVSGQGVKRSDQGYYKYYAGPVRVYDKRNLRVYGDIRGTVDGKSVPFTLKATYLSN